MTDEQRDADLVLEIPDPSAYCGLMDIQRFCGASQAAAFGSSHKVTEMA